MSFYAACPGFAGRLELPVMIAEPPPKSHAIRLLRSYSRTPANPQLPLHRSSLLFSYTSALFARNGAAQPLSHQSLAHSLPCNGGGSMVSCKRLPSTAGQPIPSCQLSAFSGLQRQTVNRKRSTALKGSASLPTRHSPLMGFFCFQQLTTVAICKSFAAKCLQQYPGWVGVRGRAGFKYYF